MRVDPTTDELSVSGTEISSGSASLSNRPDKRSLLRHLRMLARLASGDVSELRTALLASSDDSDAIRSDEDVVLPLMASLLSSHSNI